VLNNFDSDLGIAKLARALLAVSMFFTYPMESFVARHALVMLFHDGDMDGRDDPNYTQGVSGAEAGGYFLLNRRQSWTWGIYIVTLGTALLLDDIGPVLSITGSVGGGSIAYLAPGLIYLGVNGDAFLSFASNLLPLRSRPRTTAGVTEENLPIAGDARQVMNTHGGNEMNATSDTLELPVEGTREFSIVVPEDVSGKPIWCVSVLVLALVRVGFPCIA